MYRTGSYDQWIKKLLSYMICTVCIWVSCVSDAEASVKQPDGKYYTVGLEADEIEYGQYLYSSVIQCDAVYKKETGQEARGKFQWIEPDRQLDVGVSYQTAQFIPEGKNAKNPDCELFLISVTVNPASLKILTPQPQYQEVCCFGDEVSEKVTISGGVAAYRNWSKWKDVEVTGSFSWEGNQVLNSIGIQECAVSFYPLDTLHFSPREVMMQVEVQPRDIGLKLICRNPEAQPGELLQFDAIASDIGKLENIPGHVDFYVNGEIVSQEQEMIVHNMVENEIDSSKTVADVFAQTQFTYQTGEEEGIYEVFVKYIPEDENTVASESEKMTVDVKEHLKKFVTSSRIPNKKVGEEVCITLETNVDTRHSDIKYKLKNGTLPPGVMLDPSTGELKGKIEQKGSYSFKIEATDGMRTAERIFFWQIR